MQDVQAIQREMGRRLKRHLLLGSAGAIGIMLVGFAAAAGAKELFSPSGPASGGTAILIAVCSLGGVLGGVGFGWYSTYRNLRCPACDKWIWMYLSWKVSVFSGTVSNACPGCGVELFAPRASRRIYLVLAVLIVLGALGGVLSAALKSDHRHSTPAVPSATIAQPPLHS